MTTDAFPARSRAVVLGGGGVTGIAWEIGVLTGLHDAGVHLDDADAVIGTSAGAFVGVALASGYEITRLFVAQTEASEAELSAEPPEEITAAWHEAFATGGADVQKIGVLLGEIGKAHPEPVPVARRREVVEARLVTAEWPTALRVTAMNADTGELSVFDRSTGIPLIDAVTASGAVPGLWPLAKIEGQSWIDGGMVSAANATLAAGYEQVIVIAPMPEPHGEVPGARDDVKAMREHAEVLLIAPDEHSIDAIGPNPYDPDRCGPAAAAGRAQGAGASEAAAIVWS